MSVKIYTGFRLSITNTAKLQKEINELKEKIAPIAKEKFIARLCNKLIKEFDIQTINDSKLFNIQLEKNGNLFDLMHPKSDVELPNFQTYTRYGLHKYLIEVNQFIQQHSKTLRVLLEDPSLTLTFFPLRNKVLGIYYCDDNDYIEHIKNINTFEDYHYQNSSDKPKEITTRQWNKRHKDWNEVLLSKSFSSTTEIGLTSNIIDFDMLVSDFFVAFSPNNIKLINHIKDIRTHEERINKLAYKILFLEHIKNENPQKPSDYINFNVNLRETLKESNDNSIKKRFNKIKEILNQIIIKGENTELIDKMLG